LKVVVANGLFVQRDRWKEFVTVEGEVYNAHDESPVPQAKMQLLIVLPVVCASIYYYTHAMLHLFFTFKTVGFY